MKRIIGLIAVFIIAGGSLTGCGSKLDWEKFEAENGDFTVLIPGEVEETSQTSATMLGTVTNYIYQTASDEASFTISYTEMPWPEDALTREDVIDVLEESVESAKQGVQNIVDISTKDIEYDEHPGKEFEFAGTIQAEEVQYNGRIYMVGNELYQLLTVSQLGTLGDADIQKFFDSFELK